MPGLTYGQKDNKEILIYNYGESSNFSINDLPFITNGAGNRTNATLINCTSLNGVSARSKNIRIQASSGGLVVVFNLWFAASVEALELAVANDAPAELIAWGGNVDYSFPIGTEWFAIDYDYSKTGETIDPVTFGMVITIT
jgi:hypothetical protein